MLKMFKDYFLPSLLLSRFLEGNALDTGLMIRHQLLKSNFSQKALLNYTRIDPFREPWKQLEQRDFDTNGCVEIHNFTDSLVKFSSEIIAQNG